MMKICKLCLKNEADQKNSHIVPKFLGLRLFENVKPRKSIRIDISGKKNEIQDTPKEDYILCKYCEKRFAHLEHYFSLKFNSIHNYKNEIDKFHVHTHNNSYALECLKINKNALILFNYSLVWKITVSSVYEFLKMRVPISVEEELRKFLNLNLKSKHSDLIESFEEINNIPDFGCFTFKCKVKNEFTRGIYTAYEFYKNSFGIFLVDLIVFFYSDNKEIPKGFELYKNIDTKNALIILATSDEWKTINSYPLQNIGKK